MVKEVSFSVRGAPGRLRRSAIAIHYDAIAAEICKNVDSAPTSTYNVAMLACSRPRGLRSWTRGGPEGTPAFARAGAIVDGIDESAGMISYARARLDRLPPEVSARATLSVANLGNPLPFADASFDGAISPLVLHYLEDWRPTLREIERVIRPGGWFQFSTHHPAADAAQFEPADYYAVERVTDHWKWVGDVAFYRRSFTEIFDSIFDAGFEVEKVVEPVPGEEFRAASPRDYEKLMRQPAFLILRVRSQASGKTSRR